MIQNILIGVTAFCVAVYWCARVECAPGQKVRKSEIWHRFPKFVLGFAAASILFTWLTSYYGNMGDALIDQGAIRNGTSLFRNWFFALSFGAIGLSTNFRELAKYLKGGKPLILYACGQTLQLTLAFGMAYLLFFKIFPEITALI